MYISRRQFGRTTFSLAAGSALSSARVMGANDRVRVGLIGAGGRGTQDWRTFLSQADVEPGAVCDVYKPFRDRGLDMTKGRAKAYTDFRQLLDDNNIDAVIIATPDHWHALMVVAACEAGKDVYCEKPLSLMVKEGTSMLAAARRKHRVVQTGSQQRSGQHYRDAVAMIQNGRIGEVHRIHAGMQRNIFPGLRPTELTSGLTQDLDWDLWLGPARKIPFDPFRCIYNFRWFWDYSGGQMTNWGAHHLDVARWIIREKAPQTVSGTGGRYALTDGGETPDVQEVIYQFSKVVVTWSTTEISGANPVTLDIYGSKGMISLTRLGFKITPELSGTGKDKRPLMDALEVAGSDLDTAHARNFLDCVKTRNRPNADIEEGHHTATMCHLGNISTRLNRSLHWNAETEQIVEDKDANEWLMKPYHGDWNLV